MWKINEWINNYICVWKWWVWKSSMTWWLANLLSKKGKVLIADADSAPSSIDVHWFDSSITLDHKLHTRLFQVRENVSSLILWPIIPRIIKDKNHEKLNQYMDALLDKNYWLIPLLRLILQTNFYWIPADHKFFALVLQLIDLFIDNIYYSINIKEKELGIKKYKIKEWEFDYRIIDSENTSWFFDIVFTLENLQRTIQNMYTASNTTFWEIWTKMLIKWSDNLSKLSKSQSIKNPKECLRKFDIFKTMIETQTKILMVTRPWITEFNQLQLELLELKERWLNPENLILIINYYNKALKDSRNWTLHFVDSTKKFLDKQMAPWIDVKLIDCEFEQPDIQMAIEKKRYVIDRNFERIGDCLSR